MSAPCRYLVLEFVYLGDDDVDDAAKHDDEVERVPSIPEVVLDRIDDIHSLGKIKITFNLLYKNVNKVQWLIKNVMIY